MESNATIEFFENYERKVTRLICKVLRYMFFALPALLLATIAGLYELEMSFFAFAIPAGFVGAYLPTLLLILKIPYKILKYLSVLSVGLLIGMLSSDALLNLALTFLLMPLVATIYFDKKFLIQTSIAGYVIMAIGLWLRAPGRMALEIADRSRAEWYSDHLIGFSVEYILGVAFFVVIAGKAQGLMRGLSETMSSSMSVSAMLVDDVSKFSHEVNTNGNLEYRIDASKYEGGYREVIDNLNEFTDALNKIMSDIHTAVGQVSAGSKQIVDGSQSLAQGSTEQAASVEQLSSSIAEIAEKTKINAEMAGKTAALGGIIKENAEKGSRQMDEMTAAVKDIDASSQNISKVIKSIDDIAFQTNILALNASVEAARAGQHGKGFAVVAEEVRNLASKSAESAKDTERLIAESIERAELGSKIAGDTAASFLEIVSGIAEASRLIVEISKSSDESFHL